MWGVSGRVVAPNYVKNIRQTFTNVKKSGGQAWAIEKIDFFQSPFLKEFPLEWPQKILVDQIAFAAQQLYTKICFDVLLLGRRRAYKI